MARMTLALGPRIKQIRKQKGLSQEQVSEIAGIDPKSLSRIETGVFNPALDTLESLANALGVGIQDFFVSDADWVRLQKGYLLESIAKASDKDILKIADAIRHVLGKPRSKSTKK